MRCVVAIYGALSLLCGPVAVAAAQGGRADAPIPHDSGQSVSPSFEGWYANEDGTFSLVFGYFNRNYGENPHIPIGPLNRMEPGPADRGQPTRFLPRRQTGVFAVVVPADFGDRQLTWSLTAHGETIAIPGHLRPEWEITALREVTSGNTPPVVRFGAEPRGGQGPGGISTDLAASVGRPISLVVRVTDDGVQKARVAGRPPQLGVRWSVYRGPDDVVLSEAEPKIGEDGLAETSATFARPGDYVLRALAWDDSGGQAAIMAGGFFCCWTNAYVRVRVE